MLEEELFDIVDSNDKIIKTGVCEDDLHINNDITRVVTLYIFDKYGRFNIAQRVASKKVDPLKFEASAHGRVSSGESYEDAIKREAKEELDISIKKLIEVNHYYVNFDTNVGIRQHFKKLYIGFTDDEIKYDPREIKCMKSFSDFKEFREYFYSNKETFSSAVELDMKRLEEFFADEKNNNILSNNF